MALYIPDFPTGTISPLSIESFGAALSSTAPSSAVWPAANRAIFVPFRLWQPITAVKMFVVNGSAVSGNVDVGIYDEYGARLVSMGSTAQTGTSVMQTFDIADTQLGVGLFYLALALDNGTGQVYRKGNSAQLLKAVGMAQMASAFVLPATATFATVATAYVPMFGLTTSTVV